MSRIFKYRSIINHIRAIFEVALILLQKGDVKLLLYKPTSPSPCSVTLPLKKGEEQVKFCASTFNSSDIVRTRLGLINSTGLSKKYYWYSDHLTGEDRDGNPTYAYFDVSINNEDKYGKNIVWNSQPNKFSEKMTEGYVIAETYSSWSRTVLSETNSSASLQDILPYNTTNLWQLRLYENNCNNIIGYGFTEGDVIYGTLNDDKTQFLPYVSSGSSPQKIKDHLYIKIRPHTNVLNPYAFSTSSNPSFYETGSNPFLNAKELYSLSREHDDNAQYSIKIKGKEYPIILYTFRRPDRIRFYSPTNTLGSSEYNKDPDTDSYGNPLYGYAVIENNTDKDISFVSGESYQILCNYIDSDEFYYTVTEQPTVTFTINGQDGLASTQQSPIAVQYANPTFNIKYNTSYGILNHYCFTLFEKNSSGVYETIYSTKNVYSSNIVFNYNQFMSGHDYKIVASFVDNNQINIVKEVYIKAQYNQDSTNSCLTAKYYRDHHSVVLDWSKTLLITPSVTSNNAVSYGKIDDADASNNYMSLQPNNEIAYTQIDGEDSLDFKDNTIYLRIKLFPDYIGKICEVADDNGNIKSIEYDGMKLIAKINGKEKFYFYLYDTHNDWDGCENQKYYSTLATALQTEDDNLSMPFIYSEDNPTEFNWGDDNGIVYYWHEERPVSSHWYLVVLSNESFQVQDLEKE